MRGLLQLQEIRGHLQVSMKADYNQQSYNGNPVMLTDDENEIHMRVKPKLRECTTIM